MRIGERWTNSFGETVEVTARGLKVAGLAQQAAHTRKIAEAPFIEPVPYFRPKAPVTPRAPRIAKLATQEGGGEAQFAEPVPYWESK